MIDEVDYRFFATCIKPKAMRARPLASDRLEQGRKRRFGSTGYTHLVAPARKAFGDGAAGCIARTDHTAHAWRIHVGRPFAMREPWDER
jgi:hypothetical protein